MTPMMKIKILTLGLCVFGIILVAYGMGQGHDTIFSVGLLLVIAGYVLIRRRLRESIRNAQRQDRNPPAEL